MAYKFGLVSGSSMDLTNGWDFDREDHKRCARKRVREEAPYLLISPNGQSAPSDAIVAKVFPPQLFPLFGSESVRHSSVQWDIMGGLVSKGKSEIY